MRSGLILAATVLAATAAVASPAQAQVRVGLSAHGDMGYWEPVPSFYGLGATAALDGLVSEHLDLGGRLRWAHFPWRGQGTVTTRTGTAVEPSGGHDHVALYGAARVHTALRPGRLAPWGQLSTGLGLWNGCIRGDSCGGLGLLFGLATGVELPLDERWSWVAGVQVLLQTGLENGVDMFWLPGVTMGFRFGGAAVSSTL